MSTPSTTSLSGVRVRALLMPLANAKRDIENGMGLENQGDEIRDRIERKVKEHDCNVLVLTEFHRGMSSHEYADFKRAMAAIGLTRACGFKRNVEMALQSDNDICKDNPMSMETIVFTSIPADVASLDRVCLSYLERTETRDYPLVNGCVRMTFSSGKGTKSILFVHTTFSPTFPSATGDLLREELSAMCDMQPHLMLGDFNITEKAAAWLKENGCDEILSQFYTNPEQPDFVCSPLDRVPVRFMLPPDQVPEGHALHRFEPLAKDEGTEVRVASSLSKVSEGWLSVDYYHPYTNECVNGWSAEALAKPVMGLGRGDMLFDHCAVLAFDEIP